MSPPLRSLSLSRPRRLAYTAIAFVVALAALLGGRAWYRFEVNGIRASTERASLTVRSQGRSMERAAPSCDDASAPIARTAST